MFSVSTVLGDKVSDVEQSRGAGAKLPGRRPPAHCTGRGAENKGIMFGELSVVFFCFCCCLFFGFEACAWVYGNGCVSKCLHDGILVRKLWTVENDV